MCGDDKAVGDADIQDVIDVASRINDPPASQDNISGSVIVPKYKDSKRNCFIRSV